jgi:hypothetical protein
MKNSRGVGLPIFQVPVKTAYVEAPKVMLRILQESKANHFNGVVTRDDH